MEHLALEIFDREGTGSQFAALYKNTAITLTDTSEIFGTGDVWSLEFKLNVNANAHLFGSSGDLHGSRLHEQIDKRLARLWGGGLPLLLGYLALGDEVEVDDDGDVSVKLESGMKTFQKRIDGVSAQEVSVGNVVIGVALNRKRVVLHSDIGCSFVLDGLAAYVAKNLIPPNIATDSQRFQINKSRDVTPYVQQWPKFVKSHGKVYDSEGAEMLIDDTNVQTPYDAGHPFCNINVCYPLKVNKNGEEVSGRGYTMRLAHGKSSTSGGDNETRYNNAPNFYLLYFIDRLFKDMNIHIVENQALAVEDLRRVFMLNYGCHYEEIEGADLQSTSHSTPADKLERYGQYYLPIVDGDGETRLLKDWSEASKAIKKDDYAGKILLRNVKVTSGDGASERQLEIGSIECTVNHVDGIFQDERPRFKLDTNDLEESNKAYSAYLAYATGKNYPKAEIGDIVNAMQQMFGVRLIFDRDYKTVRIVLLRNLFRDASVQELSCDITGGWKTENSIRGFRMTYGKGTDDTNYFYKGFNDMFQRASTTWKDSSDNHDYSQWNLNASYGFVKQSVSAMNRTCYVTPVNGNAYVTKIDEDEDVLFPSLVEVGGFMDAEDGDCSGDESSIKVIEAGASPVIMNDVNGTYASLFSGELKAPTPQNFDYAPEVVTLGRFTKSSVSFDSSVYHPVSSSQYRVTGDLDAFIGEGFKLRMMDNYSIGNSGTPFDDADPGLQFGIMRGSGDDSSIFYDKDLIENEDPLNDWWEVLPGSGAIDHADTCDYYGNLWDYNGNLPGVATGASIDSPSAALTKLDEMFPSSGRNAAFNDNTLGYITYAFGELVFSSSDNKYHYVLFATSRSGGWQASWKDFYEYLEQLQGKSLDAIMQSDALGYKGLSNLIIEIDGSAERASTLHALCRIAYGGSSEKLFLDNDIDVRQSRFSLKLRAEKPNPLYGKEQGETVVMTKEEAADTMLELFTTSNVSLLRRPKVSADKMRAAGWDVSGSSYSTVYSISYSITYDDGSVHEILFTPIKSNGRVLSPQDLKDYVAGFNGMAAGDIRSFDSSYLILDIDTTDERADLLHRLQAIYYADEGDAVGSVTINGKYLDITDPNLRRRGLADRFYSEYSYWVRNARVVNIEARMELAQLLTIDKTKRVKIGGVTGFINKLQYTVSNETGLGKVELEILYI